MIDSTNGTYTSEYDEMNRLKSLATPQGTVKYEYDEANRRTSMTVPGQEALKYTYDEANRLKELKRGSQSVSFAYNETNMPTTTTLPDGVEEQYGYDEAGELTLIAYKKGSTTWRTGLQLRLAAAVKPSGASDAAQCFEKLFSPRNIQRRERAD